MASIEKRPSKLHKFTYRVKIRTGGQIATATFDKLSDAKKWAQDIESGIRHNRHFKYAKKHTVSELIDRYIKEVLPTIPSGVNQMGVLKWWRENLGDNLLFNLSTPIIVEYRDKLIHEPMQNGVKRTQSTVNRYLSILSKLIQIAIKEWEWMQDNPMDRLRYIKQEPGRIRCLSDDERLKLLQVCKDNTNPYIYIVVVLALSTGMRKQEIMTLKWTDVDLQRGRAVLHDTKNGDRRGITLAGHALVLLKEFSKVRKLGSDYLFPASCLKKPANLYSVWVKVMEQAELEDFHFHDLRHSAASYLAMNGATLAEIGEVLGHKSTQMSKRYVHFAETHTSKVVESMNQRLFG